MLSIGACRDEIDPRLRYRWLYQVTKHLSNIRLLTITDDCPDKASYTTERAMQDCEQIRTAIGRPIDAVFCGSDYDTDSFWRTGYPGSVMVSLPRNEMSSTEIRRDPFAHWDWLPRVVQPYYVKKVLLIGGESAGKSTLTIHLDRVRYSEQIKEIFRRHGRSFVSISGDYQQRPAACRFLLPPYHRNARQTHPPGVLYFIVPGRQEVGTGGAVMPTKLYANAWFTYSPKSYSY